MENRYYFKIEMKNLSTKTSTVKTIGVDMFTDLVTELSFLESSEMLNENNIYNIKFNLLSAKDTEKENSFSEDELLEIVSEMLARHEMIEEKIDNSEFVIDEL